MRRSEGNYYCFKLLSITQLVGFLAWIYVGTAFFQLIYNMALLVILNKHDSKYRFVEEGEEFLNYIPYPFMIWYSVQLGISVVLYKGVVERNSQNLLVWMVMICIGTIFQLCLSLYSMQNYETLNLGLTIVFRIISVGTDIYSVSKVYSLYGYFKDRLWVPPVIS